MKFLKNYTLELLLISIYIALTLVLVFYHEIGFDEIQTYLIASDASFYDIIFIRPHFEGHPPFYNLILSIFAKNKIEIDIALRLISVPFSVAASALVMFKAPFPKLIRILIPFTYFLLYQYNVICRPYSWMYLAFVLLAILYKNRNDNPIAYIITLSFLCMTSTYGMLFAGSFCLIWVFEILKEYVSTQNFKSLLVDKRFYCLISILSFAIIIAFLIWPDKMCYANLIKNTSYMKYLFYTIFILPADCFIVDSGLDGTLQLGNTDFIRLDGELFFIVLLSLILYYLIIRLCFKSNKLLYFVIPYICFVLFASFGYFSNHHLGIVVLFIICLSWICFDSDVIHQYDTKNKKSKFISIENKLSLLCVAFIIFIGLLWSTISCYNDIKYPVWYAKSLAEFFDEYSLDEKFVMSSWDICIEGDSGYGYLNDSLLEINEDGLFHLTNKLIHPDFLVYSKNRKNYIVNYNNSNEDIRYIDFKCPYVEEAKNYLYAIGKEYGLPEVYIGNPDTIKYMGLSVDNGDYGVIKAVRYKIPNKANLKSAVFYIYAYKDLYYSREDWPALNEKESL